MTNIRIATTPYQDSLLMSVGNATGWYAKACLHVTFQNVAYSAIMGAIASGKGVDVGWYTTEGLIQTYHTDSQLVYLYPWDICYNLNALIGRKNSGLKTFAQFQKQGMSTKAAIQAVVDELHGKTIINQFTPGDMQVDDLMERNGKPDSWVKNDNLDPAQGDAAFLHGTGDAYLAGGTQLVQLLSQGYLNLLAGPDFTLPPLNGFITTKGFWNAHKDAMLALEHVMFMTMRYTQAHLSTVANYISATYQHQTGVAYPASAFKNDFTSLELYPGSAGQAQSLLFDPTGKYYWNTIWNDDNEFYYTKTHQIPAKVPSSAFLASTFQKDYIAKYGANEKGWWPVTGSLKG